MKRYLICIIIASCFSIPCLAQPYIYMWLKNANSNRSIATDIVPPEGYKRTKVDQNSFADWLRHLPLKHHGLPVLLYNKSKKYNQEAHYEVIDIDIGIQDLQQCADAIIRLRAEYLYSIGKFEDIIFKFTSGHESSFKRWASGYRPIVKGNEVMWRREAQYDNSYANFRKYLTNLFIYAGSFSLSSELAKRENINDIEIGDVFIRGGFPGHAVIVVDMAHNELTGEKVFLIAQSYMPAQDIHVLKNLNDSTQSPWYSLPAGDMLHTPEGNFERNELKYFK